MDKISVDAFFDELTKIAAEGGFPEASSPNSDPMVNEGENWQQAKKDDQTVPARKANNLFGLPIEKPKRGKRQYQDQGSEAAQMPNMGQQMGGQSSANIGSSNQMSPAAGPGGV